MMLSEMPNDAIGAAGLAEQFENEFHRFANLLVGIDQYTARLLSIHVAHGQWETQFSAPGFIAFATLEARANKMEFGLGHSAFEPEQKLIVEVGGIVAAILVDKQSGSERTDLQQPMP